MNKHKLKLDDLAVESFETASASARRGTVFGHESDENSVNTLCWRCSGSEADPYRSACDFSCEWFCGSPSANCGTNYGCPYEEGPGGTSGCYGTDFMSCELNTGCEISCAPGC